jgi:UDP-glucose 4-epimerase
MRILPTAAGHDPPMQFLDVEDYLGAVDAALAAGAPGTFNIAGEGTIRVSEMAGLLGTRLLRIPERMLRSVIDWSWTLRLQRRSPAVGLDLIVHPWLASIGAAAGGLGWRPTRSSRDAVAGWAASR